MEFEDNVKEVLKELDARVEAGLTAIGMAGEGHAKDNCPVDTGRLRNSISFSVQNDGVYIGTNVEYAQHVELDDRAKHTSGRAHFLRDSATKHNKEYKDLMKLALTIDV